MTLNSPAVTKFHVVFRRTQRDKILVGENKNEGGIIAIDQASGQTANVPSGGEKSHACADLAGNIYVVWQEGGAGGLEVRMSVFSADLARNTGNVSVLKQMPSQWGVQPIGGGPDICYVPSLNKVYMAWELNGTLHVAGGSLPGGLPAWDEYAALVTGLGGQLDARIGADEAGNLFVTFRADNTLKAINFNRGAGKWELYGGRGKDIANPPAGWNITGTDLAVGLNGTASSCWIGPGGTGNPAVPSSAIFDAKQGWHKLGDNKVGAGGYSKLNSVATCVDANGNIFVATAESAPGRVQVFLSTDGGASFSLFGTTGDTGVSIDEVALAVGAGDVQAIYKNSNRQNGVLVIKGGADGGLTTPPAPPVPPPDKTYTQAEVTALLAQQKQELKAAVDKAFL